MLRTETDLALSPLAEPDDDRGGLPQPCPAHPESVSSGRQYRDFLLFLCGRRDADQFFACRAVQASGDRQAKYSAVRSPAHTALLVSGASKGRHQVGPEKQMPLPCEVPYGRAG